MEAPQHAPDQQVMKILLAALADVRNPKRGSLVDARSFDADQLTIETDFQRLLFGLGREGRNGLIRMKKPVLSVGRLELAESLPKDTYKVTTDTDWWFLFADARPLDVNGSCVLEHWAISIDPPPRQLFAEDDEGRLIAIGYPKINYGVT
jgi:hypothetical protein